MLKTQKIPELWQKKYLKTIENYRPIDDNFMRELFRNDLPLAQYVLRIITGINDLILTSEQTQYDLKHLNGSRSICLDVFGTDSTGRIFNLEVQRSDNGAVPQRARYHSSALDVELLKSGDKFNTLPITYVIFITEHDIRGEDKLIYKYEWREETSHNPLGDGAHIIFVNGAYNNPDDTSELALLMHDFMCSEPDKMYSKPLADKSRYFKTTLKGVSFMCKAIEDLNTIKATEIAVNLLKTGNISIEDIANVTNLPIEEVQKLASMKDPEEYIIKLLS